MATKTQTCVWTGKSGKAYPFEVYKIGTSFKDVGGNYIFAKETTANRWTPQYIGETQSLRDRLPNHEKLPCVERNGATHVHVHANSNAGARLAEEADLIAATNPPCNF